MSAATVTTIRHPGPVDQYGEHAFVWYDECEQVAGAASTFEAAYHQRRAYEASLSAPPDDRAELFTFLMSVSTNDDLANWLAFTTDAMPDVEPETVGEAQAVFSELLRRAKSDGVYPLK